MRAAFEAPLAATTQQRLGIAIAVAMVVGWLLYLLVTLRRREDEPPGAELEWAPNRRPYFTDDEMEGRRLNQALGWSLVMLVVIAVGLPLYWVREPGRQENHVEGFKHKAEHRGFLMFQPSDSPIPAHNVGHFGCANCHGSEGQGGAAGFVLPGTTTQVIWVAPALDTVFRRFDEEEVRTIITYGRPNTPMPPWGVEGGGAMNEQQVNDLIAYLESIQLSRDEAKEQAAKLGTDGTTLFAEFCSRCHTQGWSYGQPAAPGSGAYGPNLTNGDTLRQFPDPAAHIEFITTGSDFQKPYGVRGVGSGGMPGFGEMLTPEQIRAIVEYERSL